MDFLGITVDYIIENFYLQLQCVENSYCLYELGPCS